MKMLMSRNSGRKMNYWRIINYNKYTHTYTVMQRLIDAYFIYFGNNKTI